MDDAGNILDSTAPDPATAPRGHVTQHEDGSWLVHVPVGDAFSIIGSRFTEEEALQLLIEVLEEEDTQ